MPRLVSSDRPAKILAVLKDNKEGMWINQIARKLGYFPSSVQYHVKKVLLPGGYIKKHEERKVGERSVITVYKFVKEMK